MNDRWRDRDRWGGERWTGDDDEYQNQRRYGYGEDRERQSDIGRESYRDFRRDYRESFEPRYGQRHRGERASEYSSIPGIGTNYGGGGWLNEYSQDSWRRYGDQDRPERDWQNRRESWRDNQSWYGSRYGGENQDPYRRNYGRGLDVGDDYGSRYGGGSRYGRGESERGWWDRTKDEVRSWMGDEDAERRRQADHTGRGPKGYTRSDERLREDVSDRLMESWDVDATDIEVTVASGEVTLSGTVGDRQSKRRAEDIAANVLGVKDVTNSLRVRRVDPFATGREATSMNQGSSSTGQTASTTTSVGASTGTSTGTTTTGTSSQTPRH